MVVVVVVVRSLVVACALGVATATAAADPPSRLSFRSFGSEQGLENLSINRIAQTLDGLLWVGTDDGLYSYDGTHFGRVDVRAGLPSNRILTLLVTRRGLWVGTEQGLALLDRGRVTRPSMPGLPAAQVNDVATAPDGSLWVASDVGLFHEVSGQFALAPGWPGGEAGAIWIGADDQVVAGRGRDLVTQAAGVWTIAGAERGFGRDKIDAIAATPDGILWVRSARVLWACDAAARACTDRSADVPDAAEQGRLYVDHAGTLWVTTRVGVAHRLDATHWEQLGADAGLPRRSVMSVFEDREGSLWLAADQLYLLLGRGLWRAYDAQTHFPADTVWTVLRDANHTLWTGTNRGVVEADGDHWRTFPGTEPYAVMALVQVGGLFYAAGTEARVLRLDLAHRTTSIIGPPPAFDSDRINTLVAEDTTLWLATVKGGLLRMDGDDGAPVWHRQELPGGTAREDINDLVLDHQHRLWAAGSEGLALRDEHGTWHRLTERDGLAARQVSYLVERASGEICVAYTEAFGVTCLRYTTGVIGLHHLTRAAGLTNDKIYCLGEDRAARLYIGMGVGVDVVENSVVEHFSTTTGLVGDDTAARAFWADPDGDVLIGSTRGLARFAGARYPGPPKPVAPVILGRKLGGVAAGPDQPLEAPASGAADLDVHFATPTFANRGRLEQETRLTPVDADWRATTTDEARYTALPPGDYLFETRSRLAPGPYGPATSLAFTIAPAWWQTRWFRLLVGLGVLALVVRAVAWRTRGVAARAAKQDLERSEASFGALIEQSPDAVFVHRTGIIVYANARTATYLGYDAAELLGRALTEVVAPAERETVAARSRDLMANGRPLDAREVEMVRKDRTSLFVEVSSLKVDFRGSPALLSIARDCTERKALEARLMASDRMASIGTLAAGIAHEINNPLAYLQANLALISEEIEHAEGSVSTGLRGAIADATEGANRVQSIVQGVKTFSRVEASQQHAMDVQRALELALRMTSNELRHRCKVVTSYGALPPVLGNESRLGQVFMNLLTNAAHALPAGAPEAQQISITTRTDERGQAVIEIRDTGQGMSPEVLRRVFEPFFTTKDVGEGTGLGLSICHGIIQSLGGEITGESTVGVGSVFRIVLPPVAEGRVQTVPIALPSASASMPVVRSRKVLVIDDDEKLLASIGRMLNKEHEVVLAPSPTNALARLDRGERFDVILCDLMMPGFTGMELHAHLVARVPAQATRMLFMTGGAFTADARAFLDRPGIRWVEKPFDVRDLRKQIQAVARIEPAA